MVSEVAHPCTGPLFSDSAGQFIPRSFRAAWRAARFWERSQGAGVAESPSKISSLPLTPSPTLPSEFPARPAVPSRALSWLFCPGERCQRLGARHATVPATSSWGWPWLGSTKKPHRFSPPSALLLSCTRSQQIAL